MAGSDIVIDDLAQPRLSEAQRAALAWGESTPVQLQPEAVLAAARARTGLADFGAGDFRERLGLLCSEWDGDRPLTALHRQVLYGYLVRYASNRLLIRHTLASHPQILAERIERPVIVTGLPRSGTTHLVNLLAADSRFHCLPLWESYEPVPLLIDGPDGGQAAARAADRRADPRYQRCAAAWEGMRQVTPLLAAMHPMEPDHIHEELELMGPDFASYNFEWLSMSPRWRDHYLGHDQRPHYRYLYHVLQLLQWQRGTPGKRWVLKCPQHLEQLPALLETFPDATVVFTHRDPVAVLQSTVTMQAYTQRMQRPRIEMEWLRDYWTARIEHLLRRCVRDRAQAEAARSFDSPFHLFMREPWRMLEEVYARAQLPLTGEARAQLQQYLQAHPRGGAGRVVYRLQQDFDADVAALRERFGFYIERFSIREESLTPPADAKYPGR
ncbi:MAG: sulfotransferase [Proteobacteria bacterium]|nr:sulfotransferase [Pseudomonadota bacterium]